ncbi:MAG: hypothetical protein CMB99_01530 [Flavobacteriaceae bacterium]|nr:hypothetical protein [Flavobacteriaceae bacterium]|tara:strand:- start:5935 stop:6675 length:741 start_codon:yes stop_codon:yes gene_type:complete
MLKKFSLIPIIIFISSACTSETNSDQLKTKAIQADIKVSSNGDRTKVTVELNAGNSFGSNIRLSGGDKIIASTSTEQKVLKEDIDILDIDYEGRFGLTDDNANYYIELKRQAEANAFSQVSLPLNFEFITPTQISSINYNQDLFIQLDGSDLNSTTELSLNYGCKNGDSGTFSGSTNVSFINSSSTSMNLSDLGIFRNEDTKDFSDCSLDIIVERYRDGEISNSFSSNSRIRGIQLREIKNIKLTL